MIIYSMHHLPKAQGTVDDILHTSIHLLGKQIVCDLTGHIILSFNDVQNTVAIKNVKQKIQKVISRHKDTIFSVFPVEYTLKLSDRKKTI